MSRAVRVFILKAQSVGAAPISAQHHIEQFRAIPPSNIGGNMLHKSNDEHPLDVSINQCWHKLRRGKRRGSVFRLGHCREQLSNASGADRAGSHETSPP